MKLWTRNFTILTVGTFISAIGNSAAGIAFGILVFRRTGSPLALALFAIANIIPSILTNLFVGPFIDRTSRIKIIYTLDFISAAIFIVLGIVLFNGYFNAIFFTVLSAMFGIINTTYQVAFMSVFPEVIPEGQFSKAYSLSSLIWPVSSAIMIPIAAFFIQNFDNGTAIIMIFNAITFVVAALFETTIKINEKLNDKPPLGNQFIFDMKEALAYYKQEKGILAIGLLFTAFAFIYSTHDVLYLPFFESSPNFTIQDYSFIISANALGRITGGLVHYLFKYPVHRRYQIAVLIYFSVEIIGATQLYYPLPLMIISAFFVGLIAVTSFNIRMSATQSYIPNDKRARINSAQNLMHGLGSIIGLLVIGYLATYVTNDYRLLVLGSAVVSLGAILLFPVRLKKEFIKIYNREV